jgi:hypothetical protein
LVVGGGWWLVGQGGEEDSLGVMFKVVLKDWAILLPERFTESLTSVLELSVDTLFISNDNESIYSSRLRRTDAMLSGCRCASVRL